MTESEDCTKCGGQGLLKGLLHEEWVVFECDRCNGFGVDPIAKPRTDGEKAPDGQVKCARYQGDVCESPDCAENGCPWDAHEQSAQEKDQ